MEEKKCPFCGSKMKLRRRSLNRSILPSGEVYRAVDTILKCEACFFVATFGIPITKNRYEKLLAEWGGYRIDEHGMEEEEIKKRLRQLGYFV